MSNQPEKERERDHHFSLLLFVTCFLSVLIPVADHFGVGLGTGAKNSDVPKVLAKQIAEEMSGLVEFQLKRQLNW